MEGGGGGALDKGILDDISNFFDLKHVKGTMSAIFSNSLISRKSYTINNNNNNIK